MRRQRRRRAEEEAAAGCALPAGCNDLAEHRLLFDDEADGWAASPPAPTARGIGTCKPPSRLSVSTIAQDFLGQIHMGS